MKFAIGIPTLNRYDLLKPCLMLYERDFPNIDIFVLDNGNIAGLSNGYLKGIRGGSTNVIFNIKDQNAAKLYSEIAPIIFPEMDLPLSYLDKFKFINIKIANPQQIMINEIVKYIKENNYFGDKYHMYIEKQIDATKWWTSNFYPPSSNLFEKNKADMVKLLNTTQEKLDMEMHKTGVAVLLGGLCYWTLIKLFDFIMY